MCRNWKVGVSTAVLALAGWWACGVAFASVPEAATPRRSRTLMTPLVSPAPSGGRDTFVEAMYPTLHLNDFDVRVGVSAVLEVGGGRRNFDGTFAIDLSDLQIPNVTLTVQNKGKAEIVAKFQLLLHQSAPYWSMGNQFIGGNAIHWSESFAISLAAGESQTIELGKDPRFVAMCASRTWSGQLELSDPQEAKKVKALTFDAQSGPVRMFREPAVSKGQAVVSITSLSAPTVTFVVPPTPAPRVRILSGPSASQLIYTASPTIPPTTLWLGEKAVLVNMEAIGSRNEPVALPQAIESLPAILNVPATGPAGK